MRGRGPSTLGGVRSSSPPARQLAVQEHRQLQVGAQEVGEDERLGDGGPPLPGTGMDDGRDVDRPHARVLARVRVEIDAAQRLLDAARDRLRQRAGLAGEAEHRPVMVRVRVDVEQSRAATRERRPDRVQRAPVATLRDVRDSEEFGPHGRSMVTRLADVRRKPCRERSTARWVRTRDGRESE